MGAAVMDAFDVSDVHERAKAYSTGAARELAKMGAIGSDDGEVRQSLARAFADGFFAGVEKTVERGRTRVWRR